MDRIVTLQLVDSCRSGQTSCKAFSVSSISGAITLASPLKKPIAAVSNDDLKKNWDENVAG